MSGGFTLDRQESGAFTLDHQEKQFRIPKERRQRQGDELTTYLRNMGVCPFSYIVNVANALQFFRSREISMQHDPYTVSPLNRNHATLFPAKTLSLRT